MTRNNPLFDDLGYKPKPRTKPTMRVDSKTGKVRTVDPVSVTPRSSTTAAIWVAARQAREFFEAMERCAVSPDIINEDVKSELQHLYVSAHRAATRLEMLTRLSHTDLTTPASPPPKYTPVPPPMLTDPAPDWWKDYLKRPPA